MSIRKLQWMTILALCFANLQGQARFDGLLVWRDEFNGPKGSLPDPAKWTYDLGGGGWGNHELETYTKSVENVFLDGHGHLVIRALRSGAESYTSGRINTLGHFQFTYGRVEARMKLPAGRGLWPAFWMLGSNVSSAGWPDCGEIDIMEQIGKEPNMVHGTVHGPGYSGAHAISARYVLPTGNFAGHFHIFRAEWSPNLIQFFVDGHRYAKVTRSDIPAGTKWVFDRPFDIIFDFAVGGDWPGNPTNATLFPSEMIVDWVRVRQLSKP